MKRLCLTMICALLPAALAWADDEMPEIEKIRFCQRFRDHAVMALYNRDGGTPMKLYEEDGSNGPRIANVIIRRIYADQQIDTPKKAETFSRATCREMMGVTGD
ncbi:MAG: hypothetical protein FWF20_04770 [Betaproteobacteria bacterium]|nr:hypothetical protein [Betaproteobacteria bacterium]MCL2886091.1 hypothetical protein [Betaproteobacteria bacterium]